MLPPGVSDVQPPEEKGPAIHSQCRTPVFTIHALSSPGRPPPLPQLRQVSGPPGRWSVANANQTGRRVCCLQTRALSKPGFWLCATGGLLGSKARRNLLESYLISLMLKEITRRTTPSYQRPPVSGQVQNPMAEWTRVWGTGGTLNTSWASVGCSPTVLSKLK